MLIKAIRTKKLEIEILHSGIDIKDIKTGFRYFFVFYSLTESKRLFKKLLKELK